MNVKSRTTDDSPAFGATVRGVYVPVFPLSGKRLVLAGVGSGVIGIVDISRTPEPVDVSDGERDIDS
jgi:hypothetical protein